MAPLVREEVWRCLSALKSASQTIHDPTCGSGSLLLKAHDEAKTTAGLGKGRTTTIQVLATPNAGWCTKVAFTKVSFKSTKITQK